MVFDWEVILPLLPNFKNILGKINNAETSRTLPTNFDEF